MPPRAGWKIDPMLGGIRLKGWEAVPDPLYPGQAGRLRLVWQALGESVPDYKVSVRLMDATGRDYALGDHEPYHGEYPTLSWPTGELTYEPHDLLVSPGRRQGSTGLPCRSTIRRPGRSSRRKARLRLAPFTSRGRRMRWAGRT